MNQTTAPKSYDFSVLRFVVLLNLPVSVFAQLPMRPESVRFGLAQFALTTAVAVCLYCLARCPWQDDGGHLRAHWFDYVILSVISGFLGYVSLNTWIC